MIDKSKPFTLNIEGDSGFHTLEKNVEEKKGFLAQIKESDLKGVDISSFNLLNTSTIEEERIKKNIAKAKRAKGTRRGRIGNKIAQYNNRKKKRRRRKRSR